jgi:hypothetical protein
MQSFQIVGTFSFSDNIKTLKLGDLIKLIPNPENKQNPKSIGVYKDMKKIGYLPFNIDQVTNLKEPCTVTKLNLIQGEVIVIISRKITTSDFLYCHPIIPNNTLIQNTLNQELMTFKKYLERNKHNVMNIGITYIDESFIDLYIKTNNIETIFNTVTRKYYDKNIFKYDEFYNNGLIPNVVFEPFKIHRLENYIIKNYKKLNDKSNYKLTRELHEFNNLKETTMTWNHLLKSYCYINMYNDEYCILFDNKVSDYFDILELIKPLKLCIYNVMNDKIYYI